MKLLDLCENSWNRRPLHWLGKQDKHALLSASNKIKQLVDQTGWLRIGVSDDESGTRESSYYLKKWDGGYGPNRDQYYVTIYGKYLPLQNDMSFADLIDSDDEEVNKQIRDKIEKVTGEKKLTAADVEKINQKSLKMMQSLINTLMKTKFPTWEDEEGVNKTVKLDHVEWRNNEDHVRVSPEAAVENLAWAYQPYKRHIEFFGRELYAPHVDLYFKIKAL